MRYANPYPGLHKSPKRLADSTRKNYYYAWKGGPRLSPAFGTPEFAEAFRNALASRARTAPIASLDAVFSGYLKSRGKRSWQAGYTGFLDLTRRTQSDYEKIIVTILRPEFGAMPLAAVGDKRARGAFLAFRDKLAATSPRRADYVMQVLSIVLSFGLERGMIDRHPLLGIGRVYDGSRVELIWTEELEARFVLGARPDIAFALSLAIAIGQRASDVLGASWSSYDGEAVTIAQSKTKKTVRIPLLPEMRALLDAMPRRSRTILCNLKGEPWTYGGFMSVFNDEKAKLGISGVSFGDARGTTVTRLRRADCSDPEIAAITGHSTADVARILAKHYAAKDPTLASSAVKKLGAYYRSLKQRAEPSIAS